MEKNTLIDIFNIKLMKLKNLNKSYRYKLKIYIQTYHSNIPKLHKRIKYKFKQSTSWVLSYLKKI